MNCNKINENLLYIFNYTFVTLKCFKLLQILIILQMIFCDLLKYNFYLDFKCYDNNLFSYKLQ